MSQNESAIEVKVGALVLFSLALLGGFVFVLGDVSFSSGNRYHVTFENAAGLKPGADVAVAGLKVGQVESLSFMTDKTTRPGEPAVAVRATIHVASKHAESVRESSDFYISTRSVLGEPYIEIVTPSLEGPAMKPGSTVEGVSPPRVDLIVSKASKLLDEFIHLFRQPEISVKEFFTHSASLIKNIDIFLTDNRGKLENILKAGHEGAQNAANVLAALDYAFGEGRGLKRTMGAIGETATETRKIVRRVNGKIEPITDNVSETSVHVLRLSKMADDLLGTNQKTLQESIDNVHASTQNLKSLSGNADKLVGRIQRGEGTVGQLLQDREMYDDMRELLRIIKRQPWKIMWKK